MNHSWVFRRRYQHFIFILVAFTGWSAAASDAAENCIDAIAHSGRRTSRRFIPTLEILGSRILPATTVISGGVANPSSVSYVAILNINGVTVQQLYNGNFVPTGYLAVGTNGVGGFVRGPFANNSLPGLIGPSGLNYQQVLALTRPPAPRLVISNSSVSRPSRPLNPVRQSKAFASASGSEGGYKYDSEIVRRVVAADPQEIPEVMEPERPEGAREKGRDAREWVDEVKGNHNDEGEGADEIREDFL